MRTLRESKIMMLWIANVLDALVSVIIGVFSFLKYAVSDQSRNNEAWQRTNKHGFEHSYGAYSLPTPMQISSTNLSPKLNLTNFPTQSLDRNRIKEIFATTTRNFNMLAYRLLGSHCEAAGGTE